MAGLGISDRFMRRGAVAAVWVPLLALVLAAPLQADIRDTKHNLAKRFGLEVTDEREVCIFCHFPASVDPAQPIPEAPTWQSSVPVGYAYRIYDDIGRATLDGSTPVGSQSMACLSCHDSNQAFSAARMSIDHPFGVPYRGTLASQSVVDAARERARRSGNPLREAEYAFDLSAADFRPAFESLVENRRVFWASVSPNSTRRSKSDLPLYARLDAEGGQEVPFVECSSCHDPHSSAPMFLRVAAEDGALCLTCHDK